MCGGPCEMDVILFNIRKMIF